MTHSADVASNRIEYHRDLLGRVPCYLDHRRGVDEGLNLPRDEISASAVYNFPGRSLRCSGLWRAASISAQSSRHSGQLGRRVGGRDSLSCRFNVLVLGPIYHWPQLERQYYVEKGTRISPARPLPLG